MVIHNGLNERFPLTWLKSYKEKNGFVKATKLGTTNKFFVAATKRFVNRTKHLVVVIKYFCYSYFNK